MTIQLYGILLFHSLEIVIVCCEHLHNLFCQ